MDLDNVTELRRSIRKYEAGHSMPAEDAGAMIAFAQNAPSWKNSQTARYFAAVTPETIAQVNDCLPDFNRRSSTHACGFIVTAFKTGLSGFEKDGTPTNELGDEWGAYDLGLSNMLLLLKAREMGYDTLIMGIRDGEKLREICGFDTDVRVAAVISVGVRAADPSKPARKALEDIAVIR